METLAALDAFDSEFSDTGGSLNGLALELLVAHVLSNLDSQDQELLNLLHADQAAADLREFIERSSVPLPPLFDAGSSRLRSEEFTGPAWAIMERAATRAADTGYDLVLPPHCFLAMLEETEGVAEYLVRLQAQPDIGPGKVDEVVESAFKLSGKNDRNPELTRDGVAEVTKSLLSPGHSRWPT